MYRCNGFVLMSNPTITVTDNPICLSIEKNLKKNNIIDENTQIYLHGLNDIYDIIFNKDKNNYFGKRLNITVAIYNTMLSKGKLESIKEIINNSKEKEYLAIPFEVFESNWNNNNAQGTEMTTFHHLQELDISKEDIKKAREARENELYQQLQKLNKQCLFKMMQELKLLRTTEERKSKKKEIDKLLSDNGFISGEIDAFWTNTVPRMYSGRNER